MALKIRLRRLGAKKRPFYRICIAESHKARNGRFEDTVGTYDPLQQPHVLTVDDAKVLDWLQKGAQPTETVRSLLSQAGVMAKYAELRRTQKAAAKA